MICATLHVGDRVKLSGGNSDWPWTVAATSENFTALTQQARFEPKGTLCYTVIDWRNGRRGACNLIGQGYGKGLYSREECNEMLTEFESEDLELSHRNNISLAFLTRA